MINYSFIIPIFNRKAHLAKTLKSLDNLILDEDEEYEVIIVDDGSHDGTFSFAQESNWNFSLKYVYLPRCQRSSRSRARNYGMSVARGELYIFIDSDILVPKFFLTELKRCHSIAKDYIIIGLRLFFDEEIPYEKVNDESFFNEYELKTGRSKMEGFRYRVFRELSYNSTAMNYPFLFAQTCNFTVPAKCIQETGFDEDLIDWGIEDIEFAYNLFKRGVKIIFNSRMEVYHQFHGGQEPSDFIDENKINGIHRNTKIFYKKHGNVFDLSEDENIKLFLSLATEYKFIENRYFNKEVIRVEYQVNDDLSQIMKQIEELSKNENVEIHIYDNVERDNIDILIQLIQTPYKNIRYYPVSKVCLLSSVNSEQMTSKTNT